MSSEPRTLNAPGISRRGLVGAAAWAAPAIAVTMASPAFAVSPVEKHTLAFDGPYESRTCGLLPTMVLTLTSDVDRKAAPGVPVTVTLPTGFEWSDGAVGERDFTTDAAGQVTLVGVRTPLRNLWTFISARTATGAYDSTTVSVTIAAPFATIVSRNLAADGSPLTGGATQAGFDGPLQDIKAAQNGGSTVAYLTTDGRLYSVNGSLLAKGVGAFASSVEPDGALTVFWGQKGDVFRRTVDGAGGPQGSTERLFTAAAPIREIRGAWNEVSCIGILDEQGNLYSVGGVVIATSVTAFGPQADFQRKRYLTYATKSGSVTTVFRQTVDEAGAPIDAAATVFSVDDDVAEMQMSANYGARSQNSIGAMRTDRGGLYLIPPNGGTATLIAENVEAFATLVDYSGNRLVYFSTKDATIWECATDTMTFTQIARNVGLVSTIRSAADGASVVVFLSKTGRLYNKEGGVIAESIAAFDANVTSGTVRQVYYAQYQSIC